MSKPISPVVPTRDITLDADVVVVGSGSGGGVVAAELAGAGAAVVVVEMGGYFNEADFTQYELWAYQNLFLRGGYFPTADGNVSLVAGSALGGGSLVNWSNCIRPPADIRRRWAREFGLAGVNGEEFDAHVDAVLERISATTDCSDYNDPHRRLREGAAKLGWHLRTAALNLKPDRYNPDLAGYAGYGDQTGAKQGTLHTFVQDAVHAGARVLVRTRIAKVLVEDGHAVGVTGTFADPATGATAAVTVRAPHVVLACGALETPALLLRSGIGGPAVGRHLKLHPTVGVGGVYAQPQASWWGPPQAAILDEFVGQGRRWRRCLRLHHRRNPPLVRAHRRGHAVEQRGRIQRDHQQARTHRVLRRPHPGPRLRLGDHRPGRQRGACLPARRRPRPAAHIRGAGISDPAARSRRRRGDPRSLPRTPRWHRGEDLDTFISQVRTRPLGFGGVPVFSAHQMGSARMGTDPATSVARPTGQLHDVAGVWIGDTSAFPTCSGVNPMVTCMALARRTASFLTTAVYDPTRSAPANTVFEAAPTAPTWSPETGSSGMSLATSP